MYVQSFTLVGYFSVLVVKVESFTVLKYNLSWQCVPVTMICDITISFHNVVAYQISPQ